MPGQRQLETRETKAALCLAGGSLKLETKTSLCVAGGSWKLET